MLSFLQHDRLANLMQVERIKLLIKGFLEKEENNDLHADFMYILSEIILHHLAGKPETEIFKKQVTGRQIRVKSFFFKEIIPFIHSLEKTPEENRSLVAILLRWCLKEFITKTPQEVLEEVSIP